MVIHCFSSVICTTVSLTFQITIAILAVVSVLVLILTHYTLEDTLINNNNNNNNNASGCAFLSKLGRKLSNQSGDDRETSFLFQRLSVLIHCFNAILLLDSFVKEEEE